MKAGRSMTYLPFSHLYVGLRGGCPTVLSRRRGRWTWGRWRSARMCGENGGSQIYSHLALVFVAGYCGYMAIACWAYFGTLARLAADGWSGGTKPRSTMRPRAFRPNLEHQLDLLDLPVAPLSRRCIGDDPLPSFLGGAGSFSFACVREHDETAIYSQVSSFSRRAFGHDRPRGAGTRPAGRGGSHR